MRLPFDPAMSIARCSRPASTASAPHGAVTLRMLDDPKTRDQLRRGATARARERRQPREFFETEMVDRRVVPRSRTRGCASCCDVVPGHRHSRYVTDRCLRRTVVAMVGPMRMALAIPPPRRVRACSHRALRAFTAWVRQAGGPPPGRHHMATCRLTYQPARRAGKRGSLTALDEDQLADATVRKRQRPGQYRRASPGQDVGGRVGHAQAAGDRAGSRSRLAAISTALAARRRSAAEIKGRRIAARAGNR
jgi:hypothetical protein